MNKQQIGVVITPTKNKTAKVCVFRRSLHPKYKKSMLIKKTFLIHDEQNICQLGQYVIIESCSPISKKKNWKLKEILRNLYHFKN
jgi:small subunit ribosomal protein S17